MYKKAYHSVKKGGGGVATPTNSPSPPESASAVKVWNMDNAAHQSGPSTLTISWCKKWEVLTPKAIHSSLRLRHWAGIIVKTTTLLSTKHTDTIQCPGVQHLLGEEACVCQPLHVCMEPDLIHLADLQSTSTWWVARTPWWCQFLLICCPHVGAICFVFSKFFWVNFWGYL